MKFIGVRLEEFRYSADSSESKNHDYSPTDNQCRSQEKVCPGDSLQASPYRVKCSNSTNCQDRAGKVKIEYCL